MSKRFPKGAAAVAALAIIASAPQVSAQELVTNGGFESGDLSGWTQGGNTGFTGVNGPSAQSGSFGAFFGPIGSVGTISQTIATVAGQTYNISFWLRADGGTPNLFSADWDGSSLTSIANTAGFAYTEFNFSRLATSGSTVLSFGFQHNPAFFRLDNVSVTAATAAVPEPSTWAMMLLGFLAVGAAMRSSRVARTRVRFAI